MAEIIPDSAIYDFLISKGVDVEKPKRSKDVKGRVIDGAITGLNPITDAANMGLKKIAESAERNRIREEQIKNKPPGFQGLSPLSQEQIMKARQEWGISS